MSFYDNSPGMIDDIPRPDGQPAPADEPAEPPSVFYDASPGLRHDLPGEPDDPAMQPAPVKPVGVAPELLAARSAEIDALAAASDGMVLGSDVAVAIRRAGEAVNASPEQQDELVRDWLPTFQAHGIGQNDALDLIDIGRSVQMNGIPDEPAEAVWLADIPERLAREFGSREAGQRAGELAQAYVQRDPRLLAYLESTRLGNHPRVIVAIARAAVNAHKAGKFKP